MRINLILMRQDDPKKCTAAKLARLGLATSTKRISVSSLVLDPYADSYLVHSDRNKLRSITAIDCSWRLASKEFSIPIRGIHKKLPPLLAGNPVNYAKMHKLTTVEAIVGALYVLGEDEHAAKLLAKFSWGHTFYDLNSALLAEYAKMRDESMIPKVLAEFGLAERALA